MREGICFVLAASGVFLIVTKGNFSTLDLSFAGVLWGFVSAIFSAAYSIQPRKLIMKVGVGPVVGFGMLFGGLVASVMNPPWTMNVQWTAMSVSAFTYVVLVGTVAAFWCYLSSLKYVSAVIVGLMVCFEPLSAYFLSVFAFDPRNTYKDPAEWDKRAKALAAKFIENFKKFSATNEECKRLEKFGPHLD